MALNDLRQRLIATARAIGANPVDLATAISYETGGTFDPSQPGPRTKWGQHRGLIQFGEPQARQFGVDWNDPLNSQLGENGAVARYMTASGFKPGMSGLDLYSTINAGSPGRYGASDTAAGGAPGDVRDKWENQMAGHRKNAYSLLGMADGPKGQESYPPLLGSMAPGGAPRDNSIPQFVADWASRDEDGKKHPLSAAGKYFSDAMSGMDAPSIASMPSPSGDVANGLQKLLNNPQALAQLFMQRRMA